MRAHAALLALLAVVPSVARAQSLVVVGDSYHALVSPLVTAEDGAVVVLGLDGTQASVGVRTDAAGESQIAGPDRTFLADATACGGTRWLVEYEHAATRDRWRVRRDGGEVVWQRSVGSGERMPRVAVRCASGTPWIGWLDRGELVLSTLPTLHPQRTGMLDSSGLGDVSWVALSPTVVVALNRAYGSSVSPELVRIEQGVVTHRRSLVGASDLIAAGAHVLVSTRDTGSAHTLAIRVLSGADLSEHAMALLTPSAPSRRVVSVGGWVRADGRIALGVSESWFEGWRRVPGGSSASDAPAEHDATSLRMFDPTTGGVGPSLDVAALSVHGAWVADTLVLVVSRTLGVSIQRFRLVP